ncbi:hypothetical protein [Nostoc sp.]|uniref:hypothetical protein n=1 Tax=Nostoc sp. TaxID=1180 RepID=UPI002FFBF09F
MGHGAWGMGHGAWGMGHGAWGMGHGAWGMGHKGDKGDKENNQCPVPNAHS